MTSLAEGIPVRPVDIFIPGDTLVTMEPELGIISPGALSIAGRTPWLKKESCAMATEKILWEMKEEIAIITVNNPTKLNALDLEMLDGISKALDQLEKDDGARVGIITGAGDKAFIAGADIGGFDITLRQARQLSRRSLNFFSQFERCPKPVIAAVNGYAFGAGAEVILSCDMALASETSQFCFPEAGLGLVPIFGIVRLAQRIGPARAKYLMMSAERISATEALAMGLVNKVVAPAKLIEEALALAKQVASKAPMAVELIKSSVNRELLAAGISYASEATDVLFATEDLKEGMQAFFNKRKPIFKGY